MKHDVSNWSLWLVHFKDGSRTILERDELIKQLELDTVRNYTEFW